MPQDAKTLVPSIYELLTQPWPTGIASSVEIAIGVTPVNYAYPSHLASGYVYLERYGGAGDNLTLNDTAMTNAILVAGQVDAPIALAGGTTAVYQFAKPIVMTGSGQALGGIGPPVGGVGAQGARLIALNGRPTLSFSGLSSTSDCLTLGGSNLPQVELRHVQIQCNGSVAKPNGRDGIVILGSNKPIIENVVIWNSQRDAFVLSPDGTAGQWIEKGYFDIQVRFAGRHGVMMSLLGTLNPFINECEWRYELRGCSYVTAGGNAIRMTAVGGLGAAAKFADHRFYLTTWDCIYQTSGSTAANQLPQLPDVSPINIDSGVAQAFVFVNPAWENTANGGLPGAGYSCHVSGTGAWSGLCMILSNINSFWGTGVGGVNPDPAITGLQILDYSLGRTALVGPITAINSSGGSPVFSGSGNTTSNVTEDIFVTRTGTANASIGQGAGMGAQNTTSATAYYLQEFNGAIILFCLSGGVWREQLRILPLGGIQIGGLSTLFSCTGGPPSAGIGSNGDYAFRQDTPGTANQRLYVKSGGAWVGIV